MYISYNKFYFDNINLKKFNKKLEFVIDYVQNKPMINYKITINLKFKDVNFQIYFFN